MTLVGIGFDSHRLVAGRRLLIGGVEIPFELGLDGHSDADVLAHAVIDALLGAAGLGDIGERFPDTDERWRDADSMELLASVVQNVLAEGLEIVNVDCTVVMEAPKLCASQAGDPGAAGGGAAAGGHARECEGEHRRGDGVCWARGGSCGAGCGWVRGGAWLSHPVARRLVRSLRAMPAGANPVSEQKVYDRVAAGRVPILDKLAYIEQCADRVLHAPSA